MIIRKLLKPYIKALAFFTIFCLLFLLIRNVVEHNSKYNFLVWNLFLGFVPFAVAWFAYLYRKQLKPVYIYLISAFWLLFYPNAPYMITDFIHIQSSSSYAVYDDLLIFSFSMLSLFYGFYSLKLTEILLSGVLKKAKVKLIVNLALLLSSFGIYLGRVLRLNSWDIFTDFIPTMKKILDHLFPPWKNPVTYIMIILFTIIQWLLISLIQDIDSE